MERNTFPSTDADDSPATSLDKLGERYFQAQHTYDPLNATLLGLTEFDHLLVDPREESGETVERELAAVEAELQALDGRALDEAGLVDRDTLAVLSRGARTDAEDSLWAANASPKAYVSRQGLAFQAIPVMNVGTPVAWDAYLTRLAGLGLMFDRLGDRYLEEAARGRVPTAVGTRRAAEQLEGHLAVPLAETVLLTPARGHEASAVAARIVEKSVRPAMVRLAEVLRDRLAPTARSDERVGIRFIPDGPQAYLRAVARHTTTAETPEAIHEIGLDTLADLKARWTEVGRRAFGLSDFDDIVGRLRADPALRFTSSQEIIDVAQSALERAIAAKSRYFAGTIPPCSIVEINSVEAEHASMAYYRPPAVDGSRAGAHCLLTTNPTKRLRFEYECLAFHESVPGHHLQLSMSQDLDIRRYRRHLDVEVCSFNEGWGLYSEKLGDELGLYTSDVDVLGHLSLLALRACRLVVDTGIHHFGWSRRQAVDFMTANTATTSANIGNEVDRYIAWPGQALAYLMGQQEILRLRKNARIALGERFDLAEFHTCVLGHGPVPLSVLARTVHQWQQNRLST